jgi:cysteine desulfurase
MHGGHQEHGFRAGTENVPYIVGFGKACELAMQNMDEENTRVKKIRDDLNVNLWQGAQVQSSMAGRIRVFQIQ